MDNIKYYFTLQLTFINRHLIEFGLKPIFGIILATLAFVGISGLLFLKTQYAAYFLLFTAITWFLKLSEKHRNDFIKFNFPYNQYIKIRLFENMIVSMPFCIILIFYNQWIILFILLVFCITTIFFEYNYTSSRSIPTPFGSYPFEFTAGFRKSFLAFGFAYFLLVMSVMYSNFNLGIFALLLVFLICLTFYSEPEESFYVWVHNGNVNTFLKNKILTGLKYSSLLALPVLLTLLIVFNTQYYPTLIVLLLCYLYLIMTILAKYCNYPNTMKFPQGIALTISFTVPFLLIIMIPYFYKLAFKHLKAFLQ